MRVIVINTLDDLADDTAAIVPKPALEMPGVVLRNAEAGNRLAQKFARAKAGPHGKAYYKRLSAEMVGPLVAEYGPHDGGTPVGAGFRNGGPNMDLPNSADVQAPKFAKDVLDTADGWFW